MQKVLAMILAGGRGKRMGFLSQERPKPALPFAGRFRIIDFSLSNCIHSRIDNTALLIDYQRSHMANYLKRWNLTNDTAGNFCILEPSAGFYKGTADAVYQNLDYLQRCGPDRILILAGDHVYKMDYRKMLTFHEKVKAEVTVGVVQVPIEQAHRFGTVTTDSKGRIRDFVEKAQIPQSTLASMGIYIFNSDILTRRLTEDAAQPDSPHDFGYAILPKMVKQDGDRVYAFEFEGYWQDIGTIDAYYAANMELTREKPSFSLDGNWPVFTEDPSLSLPNISQQGSNIINSIVSPGCVVKGRVENSILSPGVRVEEEAVVNNSVLMANVSIGYHSVVDHCVLDEEVKVGKFCYVGFRTGPTSGDCGGITVLGKGATVPHYIAIGRNCKILPYVQPTDFISPVVTSESVVLPR
jgi:glucose-1-phosphate adenylyltransferase